MEERDGMHLRYFVLKPRGTSWHAKASRMAMRVYAAEVKKVMPKLASEIQEWCDDESAKAYEERMTPSGG